MIERSEKLLPLARVQSDNRYIRGEAPHESAKNKDYGTKTTIHSIVFVRQG